MSLTTSSQCPSPTFNADFWTFQIHAVQESLVLASLPAALYGIFVILTVASVYALMQRSGRLQRSSIALSLTLFVLFVSTTVYLVITLLASQSTILQAIFLSATALWGLPSTQFINAPNSATTKDYTGIQSCAGTATLTINILLGDSIVCWRACVLWRDNPLIKTMCIVFLIATFGMGIVDAVFTCNPSLSWTPDHHVVGTGSMYQGFSYGVAASVLSFSTNLLATMLVGFKAWKAKHHLRKYIVVGPMGSQMEKVFAMLIESGAVYCALWAFVVVWQAGMYQHSIALHAGTNTYWDIFGILINGALVPLIAIYPTIIIVLVALNRSHVENGLTATSQTSSNPSLRPLAVRIDRSVTSRCDHQPRESAVLFIGEQHFGSRDCTEHSSTHTSDEQKLEAMI
ncbi:hypothetical protein BD309DRAFT_899608 [Dichomitus squalens]|uniref:Uncharacterized protein n=1 Tax=Dichomitus squalens TaxID=114155 RepID=A0A4Q9NLD3_9APHY|nr:hypothetical protein BD309DRAFT_899608 [Dichomitus squalens]TBU54595.1 hypothetical protein BD310DRAFT_67272 [Dichomitus squalens]